MKAKILLSIILVLLFLCNSVYSQEILMNCVSSAPPPGNVLPSVGTVNVLIVFAQFPDDNYDINNTLWVKGSAPSNMNNWINETWTASPIQGSLTHYFNDMSWNAATNTARFKFIGKTVSVITPHSRQWYLDSSKSRWFIQKEILQTIDATRDFGEFDNWDASRNNTPDGKVDMIIFIWRNIAREFSEQEQTQIQTNLNFGHDYGSLGFDYTLYYFTVDGGVRKIYANDWGSGVSIRDYVVKGHAETFRVVVHEIAHYLIGHNNYHNGFGFWGMLSAWGYRSIVANSFERRTLGWITPQIIPSSPTQTISNIQLRDYIATGDVLAMEINSSADEYFYIENHQATSYWETTFVSGIIEPGIYVIRKVGGPSWTDSSWLQLIAADGRFDWQVNQSVANPWGSNPALLPVFKQLAANKTSGYHDNQFIPFSYGGLTSPDAIHFTEFYGSPVQDIRFRGDGKDAFRIGYNQVFSPWSNPNNQKAANTTTPFGFEITGFSSGVYTLNFYVNTSVDASPSKPQNLHLTYADQYHPSLGWDVNTESDIASYKIYRSYDNGGWVSAGTVTHPTNTFVDNMIDYTKPIWEKAVKYYVVAVDNTSKISVPSTQVETNGIMNQIPKINEENYAEEKASDEVVHDFKLYDNYPDPFNPSTTIRYQIPESGMVTLKVYDILGREAAELVNGNKAAGYYEVNFDASKLTSGVYIYTITAGKYTESKKMILAK